MQRDRRWPRRPQVERCVTGVPQTRIHRATAPLVARRATDDVERPASTALRATLRGTRALVAIAENVGVVSTANPERK